MSIIMKKPQIVWFKIDEYLLASLYMCYFNKIPLDLLVAMHEKFGRHALFFFKALVCKGYIRVSDSQFAKLIEDCKKLNNQIKHKKIIRTEFDTKFNEFLDYLLGGTTDIYSYIVKFTFDLEKFYSGDY